MRRKLTGGKIVIATHNQGKLREIAELLKPHGVAAVSAADLGIAEPAETETTFGGNARLKALHAAEASGLPALADDSGLCVDSLDGAPGIHSARWAGQPKDFATAMRKVNERLEAREVPSAFRTAHFVCALSIAWPDGHAQDFEGRVAGTLVWPPRGTKGFGYDPMFVPDGHTKTFGEMEPARKHAMSHRARAFRMLADAVL
jgi:XTP/dITP diphosphohydrolase